MARTKKVTKDPVEKLDEKVVEAPKKEYHLEIRVNDTTFKTEAVNLKGALTNFINSKEFPFAFKTRTVIRYGKGTNVRLRVMPIVEARRVFHLISSRPNVLELLAAKLTQTIG